MVGSPALECEKVCDGDGDDMVVVVGYLGWRAAGKMAEEQAASDVDDRLPVKALRAGFFSMEKGAASLWRLHKGAGRTPRGVASVG